MSAPDRYGDNAPPLIPLQDGPSHGAPSHAPAAGASATSPSAVRPKGILKNAHSSGAVPTVSSGGGQAADAMDLSGVDETEAKNG